jgi:hypothetical protein
VEERILVSKKLQKVLKVKTNKEAATAKATQKGTMKWLGFMLSFVLKKMCYLIKTRVRTDKGIRKCTSPQSPWSRGELYLGVQSHEEVEGVLSHHWQAP